MPRNQGVRSSALLQRPRRRRSEWKIRPLFLTIQPQTHLLKEIDMGWLRAIHTTEPTVLDLGGPCAIIKRALDFGVSELSGKQAPQLDGKPGVSLLSYLWSANNTFLTKRLCQFNKITSVHCLARGWCSLNVSSRVSLSVPPDSVKIWYNVVRGKSLHAFRQPADRLESLECSTFVSRWGPDSLHIWITHCSKSQR